MDGKCDLDGRAKGSGCKTTIRKNKKIMAQ